MIKAIVKETIPYEGCQQWTVFANDEETAIFLVRNDHRYSGNALSILSKKQIKGTTRNYIHKHTSLYHP